MTDPQAFTGFPGRTQATAIPNVFFTDLLPQLAGVVELTVVLCALHAFAGKRGFPRYITTDELERQPAISNARREAEERQPPKLRNELHGNSSSNPLDAGLRRAVELNILLPLVVEQEGERVDLYFLNTPADRRAHETV